MKKLYSTVILCMIFYSYSSEKGNQEKYVNKIIRKLSQGEFSQQFINEENLRDGRLSPQRTPAPSRNNTPTGSAKITPLQSSEMLNKKVVK